VASQTEPIFAASKAGITGIMRQQEKNRLMQDKLATEAFTDLQSLMGKAREVVSGLSHMEPSSL
jgi:hypothetical protein